MPTYEVFGHVIDHPPMFACREHREFLELNVGFVEELLNWAEQEESQTLISAGANALRGDTQAFALSPYLIPPKLTVFNPRNVPGHGALPVAWVFVDRKFFGIPASYLRRRIFTGCQECIDQNDPASDHDFRDYRPPQRPSGKTGRPGGRRPPASGQRPRPPGRGGPPAGRKPRRPRPGPPPQDR